MSSILQAMSAGYSPTQILNFMAQSFPSIAPTLEKANKYGYTPAKILGYLTNLLSSGEKVRGGTEAFQERLSGERVKQKLGDIASLGIGALGAYGASKALPALGRGVRGALSGIAGGNAAPQTAPGPQPMANSPVQPPQVNAPTPAQPQAAAAANIPIGQPNQPQITPPAQNAIPPLVNSAQILKQMGLEDRINNLQSNGNGPDEISAVLDVSLTPGQKKWLGDKIKVGEAKPIKDLVTDYLSVNAQKESPVSNVPKKGDLVATDQGIVGDLKDVKQKEALVESDGKLHKVKLDDIKKPDESVLETVTRLLEIPEIDRSGKIAYWSYDEPDNELFVMYHNGETYKYVDVPPEIKEEIKAAAVVPKTTGKNLYGAWSEDQVAEFSPSEGKKIVSRGATLSKLITHHEKYRKPKKGEPPNPFYRKLEQGFDYFQKLRKK